jgi:hypothetical protein
MSTALEPTFSAREAAAILGRSYSWLDQRDRNGDFVLPNGVALQPSRTAGGYRAFDVETVKEICFCCYRRRWYNMSTLRESLYRLAEAAYGSRT